MIKPSDPIVATPPKVKRVIGHIKGQKSGPVIIFLAGIHGNEPAGVTALNTIIAKLEGKERYIKGDIYALGGNLNALEKGIRFEAQDLNRIWTKNRTEALENKEAINNNSDQQEQEELYDSITDIISQHEGPFYFMDLHTTSSHTIPFITVNDTLLNRRFTMQYPMPKILGIEEYLKGPVLSFINELGYLAFGFEGGQHEENQAIKNHEAFIYVSLVLAGCLPKSHEYTLYNHQLRKATMGIGSFFEIFYSHPIKDDDQFKMNPGFVNFQIVSAEKHLAQSNNTAVRAPEKARILMPLYQEQGEDGFFLIRRIAPFFLYLSALLRVIRFDSFLTLLPGISRPVDRSNELKVNLKTARFFAKQFFHLLGYRSVEIGSKYLLVSSREKASRNKDYSKCNWY